MDKKPVPYEWMMMIHLFAHTNNYDLDALKEGLQLEPEWSEIIRRNFDEVLEKRLVTLEWYDKHANHGLDDEETLYRYLQEMYDYLFNDGPLPESGY
ncbi:hypothetical protein JJJ17_01745 [Paracoccus caeni]|uniref:Uncharacterized protein n=1 Tax=Paracoccus caeni TaxID=657651 RepID=A0A934SBG3_9RHOB|nr:hypothetical protein [Paracoccus caeni]MBK4214643.1 hypothetical protein [Paracoccus caeni]